MNDSRVVKSQNTLEETDEGRKRLASHLEKVTENNRQAQAVRDRIKEWLKRR